MLTLSLRRKTLFLLFVLLLSLPWAASSAPLWQAGRPQAAAEPAALELLGRIWSGFRSLGSKIGCHIDPDGRCAPAPTQPQIGCNVDPDGRCLPAPTQPKIGCHIDPSGKCLP